MKLMVVGGGGREHAIIKKLKENPAVEVIYALPGNGGMAEDAVCTGIGAKDIAGIRNAKSKNRPILHKRLCIRNLQILIWSTTTDRQKKSSTNTTT